MYLAGCFLTISLALSCSVPALAQQRQSTNRPSPPSSATNAAVQALSSGIEKFSITLLGRTTIDTNLANIVISPFSVWAMMTVLSEGARGRTQTQIKETLFHPMTEPSTFESRANDNRMLQLGFGAIERAFTIRTPTVELESVNAIFTDNRKTILPTYQSLLRDVYTSDIHALDFKHPMAAGVINDYINTATRGRITEIVNEADLKDGQMVLTNAVFFKGQWSVPFNRSETTTEIFYNDKNEPIGKVQMMTQRGPFAYVNMKKFQAHVLELPYGNARCSNFVDGMECSQNVRAGEKNEQNRLSMVVMVPHYGVSLLDVYSKFEIVPLKDLFTELDRAANLFPDDEVDVFLPRFNVTCDITMNEILYHMGIFDVFDSNDADLSNIYGDNNEYLSRVIHKAQIEVTEEGTVASAATAGELSNRNTPPKFIANKPFLYIIVERTTNIIVFGGSFAKPYLPLNN